MLIRVIRSVLKNWWLLLAFPLVLALTVFYLTKKEQKIYDCKMTIYTGISATSVGIDDNVKLDFFTANNAMDNLIAIFKARNTIEVASLHLLATHLSLKSPDSSVISASNFRKLTAQIEPGILKQVQVAGNADETASRIEAYMASHPKSIFNSLFIFDSHYNADKILDKIKAVRRASSDMIDISYESDDAGICKQTLELLAKAYFDRYGELKRSQNASSVEYFEKQLREAFLKLQDSENRLKDFITEHKILNYYEQGKSLAIYEKEEEQELQDVRQAAKSADAVLKKLEAKLSANKQRTITVDSLASLRDEANNIRFRIQSMMLDQNRFKNEIADARKELQNIYSQISGKVATLYLEDYSVEGVPSTQILGEWLKEYMEKEKQMTYMEQVTSSKNMVSDRIEAFAPLGAGLKRLEREVSVNESQYLTILHGLNMANLQRQSLEQASTQQVIDKPFLPFEPRASKRMMLVVASAFVGLILVIASIVGKIAFDNTLQNAVVAANKTGLQVLAAFPDWTVAKRNKKTAETTDIVVNQLVNGILVSTKNVQGPRKICIYQNVKSDNAEQLLPLLAGKLQSMAYKVQVFAPADSIVNGVEKYELDNNTIGALTWQHLSIAAGGDADFLILCLPPLKNYPLPVSLIEDTNYLMVSVNAGRSWKLFDEQLVSTLEKVYNEKPAMVLHNVHTDNLKDYFGQIPMRTLIGRNRKKYA